MTSPLSLAEMTLIHYSAKPLTTIHSEEQYTEPSDKPFGLWVSVVGDDDWKSWCESEQWGLSSLACETRLRLKPDANVLWLRGPASIDAFDAEYGSQIHKYRSAIDWARVASRYQGIIIAPYVWERRHDGRASGWYYGWDCASGCIWDAAALEALPTAPQAEDEKK